MLDIARIEAGKVALEEERFSVSALLAALHDLFAQRAREKGLNLVIKQATPERD